MKITLKGLSGATWQVEVEGTDTVLSLKEKIQSDKGHDVAGQKLIHSGKILTDETTMEGAGVKEGNFIVVMTSKPKAAEPEAKPAAAPVTPAVPATPQQPVPPTAVPEAPARNVAAVQVQEDPVTESMIARMMEMGFPRDQCEPAIRAASGPDRFNVAVEYLMTGIPENLREAAHNPTPMRPPRTQSPATAPGISATAGQQAPAPPTGPLAALADTREFFEMRMVLQQNPQLLVPLLTELGKANPAIIQAFNENQGEFLRLLNDQSTAMPGVQRLQVTQEEKEAIDRLCSLGFPRERAIEAYFACDKDESLAANFLFANYD